MRKNLGVYIHIPFCSSKCAYCDFYSIVGNSGLMQQYQDAVIRHIKESAPQLDGYLIDTVFFGGGTPSYFGSDRLVKIFDALKKYGHVLRDAEVSLEANPGSIRKSDLQRLRKAGFNRLSLGVQSANNAMLKNLGRRHTFEQAESTLIDAEKAGFDNIGIDLIFGLPSQSKTDWSETLIRSVAMKPKHISCYGLKIEKGTPLYLYKDSPFIPSDDEQADMYLFAVDTLRRQGYRQYEISNFARRGFESRHNLKYWQGEEYLGFGAAAHSNIGGLRYNYIADVKAYCDNIFNDLPVVGEKEEIKDFEMASEYLMLGLRTVRGISEAEYHDIYPSDFSFVKKLLEKYVREGYAVHNNGRWNFTPEGFLLSNVLIGEILDVQTSYRLSTSTPWQKSAGSNGLQYSMFEKKGNEVSLFQGISCY